MSHPDFSVAFHIGAHKTATSHLQRSISTQAETLYAAGVAFLGPDHLRLPGQSVSALFGLKPAKPCVSDLIRTVRATCHRLVISEENFVGSLNSPRRKPMVCRYPDAAPRVDAVAQALGQKVDVFLGIRRPTAFVNSSYCQQLMGGRIVRMAQYRRINPLESVDWSDLVHRLRAMPGVGQLVVWCHEDYATHFHAICAGLLGPVAADLVAPLNRRIHASLSAAAVAEVLHRHDLGETGNLGAAARKLLPVSDGYPPFDGFTVAEHAAGNAAYLAQIATIGAMPGVTLLDPLWASTAKRA